MIYNTKITKQCFTDFSNYLLDNKDSLVPLEYLTKTDKDFNPKEFSLVPLNDWDHSGEHREYFNSFIQKIEQDYNVTCSLMVYYPAGSYIGWHTNSNFEFYNAICTFSDTGDSFFEYVENEDLIKVQDNIGWTVKKTKWGKEDSVLHRAVSNCNRITLTFSSKDEATITTLITDINSNI